ncbi:hypothetical protein AMS68_001595 [Peltaster fructicola]|uniref:Major facilitator superfamily (MFS) profile domain-containing protein n=1 Tax=Peltaster fructicola TaxID=286661 RepID=A0A6H0XN85_9PEZI|nr:hypothetical protein AMS68_001595 [Peltaster fructicola]
MHNDDKGAYKESEVQLDDVESEAASPTSFDVVMEDSISEEAVDLEKQEDDGACDKKPPPSNALTSTLSRRSATSSRKDPGPPPDGGRAAWTQAAMAHLTVFSTWGWITSYGVFQSYYQNTLGLEPSAISWLGSVQIFLLFFLGAFTGRALDAGLFRTCYIAGAVLQMLGIFTTSIATKYWHFFLCQALCMGIANGLQFCPTMALLSTYFDRKRAFALGIGALGSCTGGVVFPVIVQQLLPRLGFGWTIRICGFIMLLTNVVAITFFRTRLPPRKSGPLVALVELAAFREAPYTLYIAGMFFNFWGLYFAFYYVGAFGRNILGMDYAQSINLLLTMVAIGFIFRLGPNYLAMMVGPLNVMLPFAMLCGIMMFAWIGVRSTSSLYVFAALYGAGSAGLQSMFPPGLASLTDDLAKAGVRMGMGFSIVSFACLSGPPLAGALIEKGSGSYLYAQVWGGISFMVGCALLVAARTAKVGWQLKAVI